MRLYKVISHGNYWALRDWVWGCCWGSVFSKSGLIRLTQLFQVTTPTTRLAFFLFYKYLCNFISEFNFSFLRSGHVRSEVLAIVLFASSLRPATATPPPSNSHSERKTKMKMKNKPKLPHIPTFTETQFFLLLYFINLTLKTSLKFRSNPFNFARWVRTDTPSCRLFHSRLY